MSWLGAEEAIWPNDDDEDEDEVSIADQKSVGSVPQAKKVKKRASFWRRKDGILSRMASNIFKNKPGTNEKRESSATSTTNDDEAATKQPSPPDSSVDSFSSLGTQANKDEGSTFFDSLTRQWVQIDNFAFADASNFFEDSFNPSPSESFNRIEMPKEHDESPEGLQGNCSPSNVRKSDFQNWFQTRPHKIDESESQFPPTIRETAGKSETAEEDSCTIPGEVDGSLVSKQPGEKCADSAITAPCETVCSKDCHATESISANSKDLIDRDERKGSQDAIQFDVQRSETKNVTNALGAQTDTTDHEDNSHQTPKVGQGDCSNNGIASKSPRRISNDLHLEELPSTSNPNTPRHADDDVDRTDDQIVPEKTRSIRSHIPRYIQRKASRSSSSCTSSGSVTKRLSCRAPDAADGSLIHKVAKTNLIKSRSNSASALSKATITKCRSRSDSSLNRLGQGDGGALALAGHKKQYPHVYSKVREYIREVKEAGKIQKSATLVSMPVRKAASLSNLLRDPTDSRLDKSVSKSQNSLHKMKSILDDSRNVLITVSRKDSNAVREKLASLENFDRSRISRLLDDLSDEDADDTNNVDRTDDGTETTFDVKDILALAIEERRANKEAKRVLSQLQTNYDELQRKFAVAESKIDRLRFASKDNAPQELPEISPCGVEVSSPAKAFEFLPSSTKDQDFSVSYRDTDVLEAFLQRETERDFAATREPQAPGDSRRQSGSASASGIKSVEASITGTHGNLESSLLDIQVKDSSAVTCSSCDYTKYDLGRCVEVDPIEKVVKWRETQESSSKSGTKNNSNVGDSLPTSPSPPSKIADFDSGYPGSDRSTKYYSLKGISPQNMVSAKSNPSDPRKRSLFNLVEEEKPHQEKPQPTRGSIENGTMDKQSDGEDHRLLKPPTMHRTYNHSITDLSSDEKSMFEGKNDEDVTPAVTNKTNIKSPRQPIVLAEQIDKEITELRNFYEDHREELMSILHDYPKDSSSGHHSVHDRRRSTLTFAHDTIVSAVDSGTDLSDLQHERKREFEKRRKSRRKSQKIQDLEHRSRGEEILTNFVLGPMASTCPSEQPRNMISSLFPSLREPQEADGGVGHSLESGREVMTDWGRVFVPRLHLDDVWTDDEAVAKDPRSFDLNLGNESDRDLQEQPSTKQIHEVDGNNGQRAHGEKSSIVVLQTCCLHARPMSASKPAADSMRPSPRSCYSAPPLKGVNHARRRRSKSRSSRAKRELKLMLSSLEQAHQLALSLRERSQEIVRTFGHELQAKEQEAFH